MFIILKANIYYNYHIENKISKYLIIIYLHRRLLVFLVFDLRLLLVFDL